MAERRRPALGVALAFLLASSSVATAAPVAPWTAKLAPRLAALLDSPDTVTVWVEFADKGEAGPADLAARLAAARASLTPRDRARRERARVTPLVDERDLPVAARYLDELGARGFRPFAVSRWLNRAALRVPGARLGAAAALPFVSGISPVARVMRSPDPAPSRPEGTLRGAAPARAQVAYGQTASQLAQINIAALHDSGYVGTGILVCILDNGFTGHATHEALASQIIPSGYQRDFVDGDLDPSNGATDLFPHGAWVMGCVGGNKPGTYVGSAFGATFALGRTENDAREYRDEMLYWGMGAEWADSLGADMISSSVGYNTFDAPDPSYTYADMNGHTTDITRYAEIAASKGILVVNAVGNEGNKQWHYLIAPADVSGDSLIAVGAVDDFGRRGNFSSFGPSADGRIKPDLAARGVGVPLVAPWAGDHSYESEDGTSFSAPLVAGLAACLLQARPAWRPVDVIRALRESASQASHPDNSLGYGIPDGARALCWVAGVGIPNPATAQVLGPNPMRAGDPPVIVRFAAGGLLEGSNPAHIRVLDLQGRRVRDLWSGALARGQCLDVSWDGRDHDHRLAHSGCYFVSLTVGGEVTTARVVWLR